MEEKSPHHSHDASQDTTDHSLSQKSDTNSVERYYDQSPLIEWQRLEQHRTEFAITQCALNEYLPIPPATVLDIGGGPGRYALALAKQGYQVTLLDLSHNNLEFAREQAHSMNIFLVDYINGNALHLDSIAEDSFDAVLLMGPLYHLSNLEERVQAVREAWRVLKPGGFIFAAFITRYAPFRDLAKRIPHRLVETYPRWAEVLETGMFRPLPGGGFTNAYFTHPDEIYPLMEPNGFSTRDLIACEGIVSMIEEKVNTLVDEHWRAWVELNYRLGKDPSIHGAAEHLLYVGQKKLEG